MNNKQLVAFLLLCSVAGVGCAASPTNSAAPPGTTAGGGAVPPQGGFAWVSIIRLVANPTEYDGKNVHVEGYFVYDKSGVANTGYLYLNETDFKYDIARNAIAIKIPNELLDDANKLDRQFLVMNGAYTKDFRGPNGFYAGGLILHDMRKIIPTQ